MTLTSTENGSVDGERATRHERSPRRVSFGPGVMVATSGRFDTKGIDKEHQQRLELLKQRRKRSTMDDAQLDTTARAPSSSMALTPHDIESLQRRYAEVDAYIYGSSGNSKTSYKRYRYSSHWHSDPVALPTSDEWRRDDSHLDSHEHHRENDMATCQHDSRISHGSRGSHRYLTGHPGDSHVYRRDSVVGGQHASRRDRMGPTIWNDGVPVPVEERTWSDTSPMVGARHESRHDPPQPTDPTSWNDSVPLSMEEHTWSGIISPGATFLGGTTPVRRTRTRTTHSVEFYRDLSGSILTPDNDLYGDREVSTPKGDTQPTLPRPPLMVSQALSTRTPASFSPHVPGGRQPRPSRWGRALQSSPPPPNDTLSSWSVVPHHSTDHAHDPCPSSPTRHAVAHSLAPGVAGTPTTRGGRRYEGYQTTFRAATPSPLIRQNDTVSRVRERPID